MGFEFFKIHGAGNDFVVVDNRKNRYNIWQAKNVNQICRMHTGIGADGLLLLEESDKSDFKMRFFNSDGYESEMCVNGSRCISYFAYQLGIIKKKFTFEAGDGLHRGEINQSDTVKVEVKVNKQERLRTFPDNFQLPRFIQYKNFINTGVPHLILHCDSEDLDSIAVKEIGSKLRFHEYFQPQGTNVNFVKILKDQTQLELRIRTYERGVEAETLSCGSGATAAALSYFNQNKYNSNNVVVITKGGLLKIYISLDNEQIFLEGPVEIAYRGKYLKEDIS